MSRRGEYNEDEALREKSRRAKGVEAVSKREWLGKGTR